LLVNNQISEAGNYNVLAGKEIEQALSFNYNRKESDLKCYTNEELKDLITKQSGSNMQIVEISKQSLTVALAEAEQGVKLWKLCIILALVFLAVEVILLKLL
jgi:hypothetical protein